MDIYPSFLEKDPSHLLYLISQAEHVFEHVQIDIADNSYTPTSTCSAEDIARACAEARFSPSLNAEIHLMVENLDKHIHQLQTLNDQIPITEVIVHLEPAIRWTKGHPEALNELLHAHFPFAFGIAIGPEVVIREHIGTLLPFETVQIMTVYPGKQGSPFLADQLRKIQQLRKFGFNGRIVLDGGISSTSLQLITQQSLWPDAVCPGSYFSQHPLSMRHAMEELYEIVTRAEDAKIALEV